MDPKPLAVAIAAAVCVAIASRPALSTVLPCQITVAGHAYTNGTVVNVSAGDKIVCGGMFSKPSTPIDPGPGPGPAVSARTLTGSVSIPFPNPGVPFIFDRAGGITLVPPPSSAAETSASGMARPASKSLTPAASTTTVTYTTTYRWGIIGGKPIANYVTGTKGYVVPLPSAMNASGTTFYFTDSSINGGGNAEVTVDCEISGSDGSSYSENGYLWFNVYKPSGVGITASPGVISYLRDGVDETLYIGTTSASGTPGMTMFPPKATQIGGNWAWLQLLHKYNVKKGPITVTTLDGDPSLDSGFPYDGNNLVFNDSPSITVTDDGLGFAMSLDFSATTYLMWNSGAPGAIFIPIASEDWDALAQIQNGQLYGTEPNAKNYHGSITDPPTWQYTFVP